MRYKTRAFEMFPESKKAEAQNFDRSGKRAVEMLFETTTAWNFLHFAPRQRVPGRISPLSWSEAIRVTRKMFSHFSCLFHPEANWVSTASDKRHWTILGFFPFPLFAVIPSTPPVPVFIVDFVGSVHTPGKTDGMCSLQTFEMQIWQDFNLLCVPPSQVLLTRPKAHKAGACTKGAREGVSACYSRTILFKIEV